MSIIKYLIHHVYTPIGISFLSFFVCICFYYLKTNRQFQRKIFWIAYAIILIGVTYIFSSSTVHRISNPGIWDFSSFYLWGKTAADGYNFYLPENLTMTYNSISFPFSHAEMQEFIDGIVKVGFLYPPPTILYFLPLGFFSFTTSLIIWSIFNIIIIFASIYLICDLFFRSQKLNGLFLASILLFTLKPSITTLYSSQTNFILLLLLLLMKKYSENNISGIFLSIAFLTKPFMIIFIVFFLLRKQWKVIIYFIASTLVISVITIMLFGKEPFVSYIFNNPSLRIPKSQFSEEVNQSLNAVLIRNNIIAVENHLIYLIIVAGILLITAAYLFYLSKNKIYDYIWAVLLLIGLLIYPGTLSHYGTLLLFIIFQFFDEKKELGFNQYFTIPIIAIFYLLSEVSVFVAICFLLGLVVLKSLIASTNDLLLTKPTIH